MPSEPVSASDFSFVEARLVADGQSVPRSVGHRGRGRRTVEPTRWLGTLFPPQLY